MNNESSSANENLKNYLFYNQIRVNVAVAVALVRKTLGSETNRNEFISKLRSKVLNHWSENQPKDGFRSHIISNLQEKCIRDFINVLPGSSGSITDTKVPELMCLVRKSIDVPLTITQSSDSDLEDEGETAINYEFLRLVTGLKNIVESKRPVNFDKNTFKITSDCDDSGVDCDKTNSTLNCTNIFPTSVVTIPSIQFRSITHSSDTSVVLKVTLQKLLVYIKGTILKSAQTSVNNWKDSHADMSVTTVRSLVKDSIHVETISEFISKIFLKMWNNLKSTEISELQYQRFIFSKLLCHINICTRLIEDLVQCIPPWCSEVEKLFNNIDHQDSTNFISNGPLLLDLVTLILKKWCSHLKCCSNKSFTSKNSVKNSTNIKDLWKTKWDRNTNIDINNDTDNFNEYIRLLKNKFIKFVRRMCDGFLLVTPQVYCIIAILDNCHIHNYV